MSFNETKCKVMHVSHKRSPVFPTIPIMLNGTVLEMVSTFKYLGLLISSDLSWTPHSYLESLKNSWYLVLSTL